MNCIVCDKPIGKKARTCSDKCKQQAYRNANRNKTKATTVTSVTLATVTKPTVTDLGLCQYCGEPLPPLAKPRRWPGACYPCAMKAPRKSSLEALGEVVCAGSAYVPPKKGMICSKA